MVTHSTTGALNPVWHSHSTDTHSLHIPPSASHTHQSSSQEEINEQYVPPAGPSEHVSPKDNTVRAVSCHPALCPSFHPSLGSAGQLQAELTAHHCFQQHSLLRNFAQAAGQRGREMRSSSPRAHRTSQGIYLRRRGVSVTLSEHTIYRYPQDKAPGKRIRFYPGIYGLFFFFIIITHLPKLRIKSYFLSPSSREFPKFLFPMTQSWCQKRCNNKSLQSWGKQDYPFSAQDGSHLHCSQISKYFIYFNRAAQKTQPANREQRVEANKEQRSRSSQSSTRHQEPNQTKTRRQNLENDSYVQLTPFPLTRGFLETARFATTSRQ